MQDELQYEFSYSYSILLGRAYRTLRSKVYDCLEKHSLIPTHWSLIGLVYESKTGIKPSDVALKLGVTLPLVTLMTNFLESEGYIDKVANKADGRSKLLVATKAGRVRVKAIEAELSTMVAPLLQGVSQKDLHAFRNVLQAIVNYDVSHAADQS